MKVAIVSEFLADQAALRILVEAVLNEQIEPAPLRGRPGGWHAVLKALPAIVPALYYGAIAEGLVVVLDSNRSPVHEGPFGEDCQGWQECRLCQVRRRISQAKTSLKPVSYRGPLLTAIGLAVPAIEAWYLCGENPNVSENAWIVGMREDRPPYTRSQLKQEAYGTQRASLALETERATEEMHRVVANLDQLERKFPQGFGALRSDLRGWL